MTITHRQSKFALLMLFAINFMNMYDRQVVGAIGEKIKSEWQLTDGQLAGLTTAFILLYAVVGIPLGRLADIGNRKRVLAVGVTVWSLFTALSGIAGSFRALIVYRLGVGIGEASAAPAANSLIGDLFPPHHRARAISIFMLGIPLGLGASYLISGMVAQATGGWRPALFVAAAPGLVLGLLALRLPEPVRGASDPDVLSQRRGTPDAIAAILKTPTMWWIIASGALFKERSGRNVFRAAGGVVADFLGGVFETPTPERKEVRGDNLIVEPRRRSGREAFRDDLPEAHLAGVGVVPEQSERFG